MPEINSFRDVIALWPSPDVMASDVGAPVTAVRKWWQRDRIPAEWWHSVLASDVARSAEISAEALAAIIALEARA